MKTKNLFVVKNSFFTILAIVIVSASCNKAESIVKSETITEEEAAEVMVQSMSQESGGLVVQTESVAEVVASMSYACGQAADTSFSGHSANAAIITYNYLLQIQRTLYCEMGMPQRLNIDLTGHTTYSAPKMSSDDSTSANFVVSGFEPSSDHLVLSQTYERDGSQQSKVRLQRSFTSKLTAVTNDIMIDKSSLQITSGTIEIVFNGSLSNGKSVSYAATISLNGNKEGVIVFKNGSNYAFKWN